MATTALNSSALPGKPYSFLPKAAAGVGPHTGSFTSLSVLGVPGERRAFSSKSPAGEGEHTGDFTRLSVLAVPGGIRAFTAKQVAVPIGEGAREAYPRKRLETEEEELIFLISCAYKAGYLN